MTKLSIAKLTLIGIIFALGYAMNFYIQCRISCDPLSQIRLLFLPLIPFTFLIVYTTLDMFYKSRPGFKMSLIVTGAVFVISFVLDKILNYVIFDIMNDNNILSHIYDYIRKQYYLSFFVFSFLTTIIITIIMNRYIKINTGFKI